MKTCPTCHSTYPSDFAVCPRDATPLVEVGVWSEGTEVTGKYRILSKLGEGGMAVVYKALHVRFDELRALKVMTPELASNQTFVKRFMHEAIITRKLQHPNAVRVEDIDEAEDGRPFIVMEYIEGRSLKEVIRTGAPMPVERVCSIAKQVAAALHAAHRLGMVHRDIKPANIVLVGQDPSHEPAAVHEHAKVLDFGIAKIKEAHLEESRLRLTTLTGTGMVIGTPAYMSPEQAMGKRGEELDGRSDLYSLGVVMYQMLVGDLPLKADSQMQMLMAQINTRPPDIRTKRPELPQAITSLVMRCLEKLPDQRLGSGQALIEEIEHWEQELARLAPAQAGQERLVGEQAEVRRHECERADQERQGREMAETAAKLKASREPAAPVDSSSSSVSASVAQAPPIGAVGQPPVVARRTPRTAFWVALSGCVVVLAGAGWYFSSESRKATQTPIAGPPAGASSPSTAGAPRQNRPTASQEKGNSQIEPAATQAGKTASGPPTMGSGPARNRRPLAAAPASNVPRTAEEGASPKRAGPSPGAADAKMVNEATTLCQFYYDGGEYDKAIAECQNGLNLDPSNTRLNELIRKVRNAKANDFTAKQ
jgi:serine/threonine protein kinase